MVVYVHIGIDDADSHFAGCTTYVTYRILRELLKEGVQFPTLPHLVRLNPYVPFKTRGNAATKIVIAVPEEKMWSIIEKVEQLVDALAERRGKASYGLAVYVSNRVEPFYELTWLYVKAIRDIVTRDMIEKLCQKLGIKVKGGRGVVGAVAALGAYYKDVDATYELLVYTNNPEIKQKVNLTCDVIEDINILTSPLTFLNLDPEEEAVLLMPSGPDPVLIGVRGDDPVYVTYLAEIVLTRLRLWNYVEGWLLYITNQGTEVHVEHARVDQKYTFMPVRDVDHVRHVERIEARHISLELTRDRLLVYRHLGKEMESIEDYVGWCIEYWGARRLCLYGYFTYPEGFRPLVPRVREVENPTCPICRSRLKSAGKKQGFYCEKCRQVFKMSKLVKLSRRTTLSGSLRGLNLPKLSEHRHLMKSTERIGIEKFHLKFSSLPPLWIL